MTKISRENTKQLKQYATTDNGEMKDDDEVWLINNSL